MCSKCVCMCVCQNCAQIYPFTKMTKTSVLIERIVAKLSKAHMDGLISASPPLTGLIKDIKSSELMEGDFPPSF